jgi:hypothetical protein
VSHFNPPFSYFSRLYDLCPTKTEEEREVFTSLEISFLSSCETAIAAGVIAPSL